MITPLKVWQASMKALPTVSDKSWALNVANWYATNIIAIMPDKKKLVSPGFLILFPTPVFAAALVKLKPVQDPKVGIQGFADAWEKALLKVKYPATMLVATGTFKVPASDANTFSAVASAFIEPASIAAGKKILMKLAKIPPTKNMLSQFPQAFRDATLALKITIDGTNSTSPTPSPLKVTGIPLV